MVGENPRDYAVQRMFDRIARRYDLLNRIISLRLDVRWRDHAVRSVLGARDPVILDLGAGTGDLTFAAAKAVQPSGRVVGLDFSLPMLARAQEKRRRLAHGATAQFVLGSALLSPFREAVFDGVISAFVLRNVSDLSLFFADAFRVLKPGGKIVTLDMFPPPAGWFSFFYDFYFYRLVPRCGGLLAGDRQAYQYLSQSVRHFHSPEKVADIMRGCGFDAIVTRRFLNGAVCMHCGQKQTAPGKR